MDGTRATADARLDGDKGYVLALAALLILPLMAFVGFAVDLGAWYSRAAQIQAAADASALAGATYLPDEEAAEEAALEVAARNGFSSADGYSVTVTPLGAQRLRVDIRDSNVDQYFTRLFSDDVQVERAATAQRAKPVTMGSPRNFLGTGPDPANILGSDSRNENYWLAISGPCSSQEQGDYLMPITDANWPSGGFRCTGGSTMTNDAHTPEGYFYAVEVPEEADGEHTLYIDAYDASHCSSSNAGDSYVSGDSYQNMRTVFRVRGPDASPYDPSDNPVLETLQLTTNNSCSTYRNQWRNLESIGSADAGIYFVQVYTERIGSINTVASGSNGFALRASYTSSWSRFSTPCSADPTDGLIPYDDECPQVYATEWMGVLANISSSGGGTNYPSFYLAQLGHEHSKKKLRIRLWDTGEGAQNIEILDPLLRSVEFDWEIVDRTGSDNTPTGGWSGSVNQPGGSTCSSAPPNCSEFYVGGDGTQPGSNRLSDSRYNDRFVQIEVQLPDNIQEEYGGRTWWKIRYHTGSSPTDRTTWSVSVLGDPVRLIPNPPS